MQTSSQLYVWQSDGTPLSGFPVSFQEGLPTNSVPLVADVTGDGKPDVILASAGFILVYSATGVREAQLSVPDHGPSTWEVRHTARSNGDRTVAADETPTPFLCHPEESR